MANSLERKLGDAWAALNCFETPKGFLLQLSRDEARAAFDVLNALLPKKLKDEAWQRRMGDDGK